MTIDLGSVQGLAFDALPVLLDAAAKGMGLLAAAGTLVLAMRKTSAAARQVVWMLALAALLALPLASAALPSWQVLPGWAKIEMPPEPAVPSLVDPAGSFGGADRAGTNAAPAPLPELSQSPATSPEYPDVLPADVPPSAAVATGSDSREAPAPADVSAGTAAGPAKSWRTLFVPAALAVWLAGTLACLLPLLLGRLSLRRLARGSRRIDGGSWALLLRRAAKAVGIGRRVQLLQSDTEPMPMVWGVLRPKLLLPAEAEEWPADRRWVVLLHELAHTKRHDCLAKLIAHVACAAYWFNPLCWVALKLMQREAEAACDDLVLSADHASTGLADLRPSDYAQHLLEIASGLKSGMLVAYSSIAMAKASKLEGRLRAILDGRRNRRALTRLGLLVAAVLVAGIAVPIAVLKATGPEKPLTAKPDDPATQPTVRDALPQAGSTFAVCVIPNVSAQAGRSAMISAGDAAKWKKQLAAGGPKAPKDGQRYWWAELGESMMPPPQVVIADYRGRPHILLCGDWPRAVTSWRDPAFRSGIVSATAVEGPRGKQAVQVTLDKEGRRQVSFIGKSYKGLTVAFAIDGRVLTIDTITDPQNEAPVVAGGMSKSQAEALARRLLVGMPAVKAMREAIQSEKAQEVRDLLRANPALIDAASQWPRDGEYPLHQAVTLVKPDMARMLLDHGADVNAARGRDGYTPLHLAVANGRDEIIRLLLGRGADLKAVDKQGFTPLCAAVMHGRESTAAMLLDAGADVNATDRACVTPLELITLMEVMSQGQPREQREKEKMKAVAALLRRRGGKMGIIGAAATGDAEAVRGFLKADPSAIKKVAVGFMTPLAAAAMGGHASVVKLLLDAGASTDAPAGSPVSPLAMAAGCGHLDVVKLMVARGANVNPAGENHEGTPLTMAAYQGRREVVEFLLEKGAKLDGGGKDGNALISACKGGQVDIVRLLLDKGLDVNSRTKSGQTPLIALVRATWSEPAKKGVLETAKLLLDRGADVNARDSQGYTALSHACYVPFSKPGINADLVKLLIDRGANVEVPMPGRGKPLHRAAEKDDEAVASLLLDAGADVLAEDIHGTTPLEIAERNKSDRAAEVIRKVMEPRLAAMRQKVMESLQPLLEAMVIGDVKAAMAAVAVNPECPAKSWQAFIDSQHKALAVAPGRNLAIGAIAIRGGWAAAAVTDAKGRPGKQTVITLMEYPDGSWRPVQSGDIDIDGIDKSLRRRIHHARTFDLGAFRLAVMYKAGKVTGPPPNSNMGGSMTGGARTVEITASGGMLSLDWQTADPQRQWSVEVVPDGVLRWSRGGQELSWARSLKLTGSDGLVLEARDGKATFTRGGRKTVLEAVGDSVRMQSEGNALTATRILLDLPTLKASTPTESATQPIPAQRAMDAAMDEAESQGDYLKFAGLSWKVFPRDDRYPLPRLSEMAASNPKPAVWYVAADRIKNNWPDAYWKLLKEAKGEARYRLVMVGSHSVGYKDELAAMGPKASAVLLKWARFDIRQKCPPLFDRAVQMLGHLGQRDTVAGLVDVLDEFHRNGWLKKGQESKWWSPGWAVRAINKITGHNYGGLGTDLGTMGGNELEGLNWLQILAEIHKDLPDPATRPARWTRTQEFPAAIVALAERQDRKRSATPWRFEGVAAQVLADGKGRYRVAWVKKDPLRDSYWYDWYEFAEVKLVASGASSIPSLLKVPDVTKAPGWDSPSAKASATHPAVRAASPQATTQPAKEPSASDAKVLEGLWEALADTDADKARAAIWALASKPEMAAGFLAGKLRPAGPGDAESIRRLIADLDNKTSAVRNAASAALESLDCVAEPALAEAAKGKLSAEARTRIGQLLDACRKPLLATQRTRQMVRGIWALETMAGPQGRAALARIAKADERHRASALARAALARLDGNAAGAGQYVPKLRYVVRVRPGEVKAGGSIPIEARLINEGKAPVAVYWGDYAYEDMYRFAIRRDGKPVPAPRDRFAPPGGVESRRFRELAPGGSLHYEMFLGSIGANCQRYFLRYPGKYTIEPGLHVAMTTCFDPKNGREMGVPGAWSGQLEAEPVSITISENPSAKGSVTVSGRVVDAVTGKPVPGAKVVLISRRPPTGFGYGYIGDHGAITEQQTDYAFSGADGRFSFGRLPEDVPQFSLRSTHADYASASAIINFTPPKKQYQATITMHPGIRVRGRIVDSAGLPVVGARVSHADKDAFADRQGRFALSGVTASEHDGKSGVWVDVWKKGFVRVQSWSAPRQAHAGQWAITIRPESELAFSGRAVFADGSATAGVGLEFRLKDAAGKAAYARGKTDGDGKFSIVLSRAGEFAGKVQATGAKLRGYGLPRERWLTSVAGLSPGMKNVRIVFEDRGSIRAAVRTANTLPESLKFRVLCDMADVEGRYCTVRSSMLDSSGGTAAMDRLSSGKYRVTVTAVPQEHWRWTKEVVLDANAPGRAADLDFFVPEKKFGNVRATILAPDGKTPVAKGRVWMDSSASWGGFPIVNGAVALKDIPVGKVWLTTTVDGMAGRKLEGFVRDGQTTDFGRIVLQRLEDATGVVAGRVLYDDGTPAIGAVLVGDGFQKTPVGANGKYSVRRFAGKGTVVIDLAAAVGWPHTAANVDRLGAPWGTDTILADANVPAGGTVKHDIILPRKKIIDLGVDFRAAKKTSLSMTIVVELDRCRLVRTWSSPEAGPGIIRIPNLPSGATTVSLHAANMGYRSCQAVAESKLKDGLVFDPSVTGKLTVRTVDRGGKAVKGVRLSVCSELMAWLAEPVRGLRSNYFPISGVDVVTTLQVKRELADGTHELTGLAPGAYIVQATGFDACRPVRAQVQAGKTTTVKMVVDTDDAAESPDAANEASTQPVAGAAEIDQLIKQLGSGKVAERKKAHAALIAIGRPAEARLLAATKDANLERARRAELALREIEAAKLKLEFRIAPRPSAMEKAELRSCMGWLKDGRVGFWWKDERIAGFGGRMPRHAWLPIAGGLTGADQLVTGECKGRKYVLVSDRPGQTMLPGKGENAWYLEKVYATKGGSGRPAVGFELDARGAELFAALTKANIRNGLAVVIDDKVVSAPVLMVPLGKKGMITGRFSEQEVKDLVNGLKAGMSSTPDGASTTRGALDLDDAARRLTKATGAIWRASRRERAPGLGAELSQFFGTWHGVAVPYCVLPFALDEQGKAKLALFRKHCSAALDVIASDDRCIVLAGPSREPDVTAKVLAVLGVPASKEAELRRRADARAEWLDFRLAVAGGSGAKGDRPLALANGPTVAQIKDYRELFAAKGPNGGRHRGDSFLWFHRLRFCEPSPRLVTTESKHNVQYVLLSNRPEHVLLSGSARPRPWHLKRVYATTDPQGRPAIGLELDAAAAKRMGKLTGSNIGRPLAILFHDNVLSVSTIEVKLTDKVLISGGKLDKALVDKIVRSLSECMLADNEAVEPAARPATQPAPNAAWIERLIKQVGRKT